LTLRTTWAFPCGYLEYKIVFRHELANQRTVREAKLIDSWIAGFNVVVIDYNDLDWHAGKRTSQVPPLISITTRSGRVCDDLKFIATGSLLVSAQKILAASQELDQSHVPQPL